MLLSQHRNYLVSVTVVERQRSSAEMGISVFPFPLEIPVGMGIDKV